MDYEKLTGKPAAVVSSIVELIGVKGDKPQTVRVTLAEKPSDQISQQWAVRFEREIRNEIQLRDGGAGATVKTVRAAKTDGAAKPAKPKNSPAKGDRGPPHIFDRYNAIEGTVLGLPAAKRLRHRYEVVVARNRALLKNARVLDLRSGDGRWSYAAIEAGAAQVVGIDSKQAAVEAAGKLLEKLASSRHRTGLLTRSSSPHCGTSAQILSMSSCVGTFQPIPTSSSSVCGAFGQSTSFWTPGSTAERSRLQSSK